MAQLRGATYIGVIVSYLLVKAAGASVLSPFLSFLSFIAILISIPAATPLGRAIATVFVCTGSVLLWRAGVDLRGYVGAFGQMAYLLALFAVLPVLAEPIKLGGYSHAIQQLLLGRVRSGFALNCIATAMAYLCGSVISLAAIPIMMTSMRAAVEKFDMEEGWRFLTVSSISGYVLPLYWTPVSGIVGVVLTTLRLDWTALFPLLFGLSVTCLAMNWLVFYLVEGRKIRHVGAKASAQPDHDEPSPFPRLLQMALGILIFVSTIVGIEHRMNIGMVTVVTLIAIPAPFIWCMLLGRGRQFIVEGGRAFVERMPRMADQYAIFLSAGFLATAIGLAGVNQEFNSLFMQLNTVVGSQFLLLMMPVMALAASFIGIHPIVAIALLAEVLRPEILGIAPSKLAVVLVGSSVLTFMLGPFSGTLGLVQMLSKISAFRLARWNAPYAMGYFLVLSVFIFFN